MKQIAEDRTEMAQQFDKADELLAKFSAVEDILSGAVTWGLVHEIQEAADLARLTGRLAMERQLSNWAVKLCQALSTESAAETRDCTSQFWIG